MRVQDREVPPRAVIFDLDGVVTDTASVHARAWKVTFDQFLAAHAGAGGFRPFDEQDDYLSYVDGRSRLEGIRRFLRSRGIEIEEGAPDAEPDIGTVHGLGALKNGIFRDLVAREGVRVFPGSARLLEACRRAGLRLGCVSGSRNCRAILRAVDLDSIFGAVVEGTVAAQAGLRSKPAPDMYVSCARVLRVEPALAAVFEDAESGVAAARAGGFGLVVGVDRGSHAAALRDAGAHCVVADLGEFDMERLRGYFRRR